MTWFKVIPIDFGVVSPHTDRHVQRTDNPEIYRDHFEPGHYVCSQCGYELFSSRSKIEHHSVWPHFNETMHPDSLKKIPEADPADGIMIRCGKCENPVGHEFISDVEKTPSRL